MPAKQPTTLCSLAAAELSDALGRLQAQLPALQLDARLSNALLQSCLPSKPTMLCSLAAAELSDALGRLAGLSCQRCSWLLV
jgi:hypothetical protein